MHNQDDNSCFEQKIPKYVNPSHDTTLRIADLISDLQDEQGKHEEW